MVTVRMSRLQLAIGTLITVLAMSCPSVSEAQGVSALFKDAVEFVNKGQPLEAIRTTRLAMLDIWSNTPLSVAQSVLVKEKATGYGMYAQRPDNVYKAGDPILLYVEPVGYTIKREGDVYAFGMSADFEVTSEDGKILGGQRGFGRWSFKSRRPNFELFINLTYTLTGVKPGEYTIETKLKDAQGPDIATVRTKVVIK